MEHVLQAFPVCSCRTWDLRSHKGAYRIQTPGMNFDMAWNPHDPNMLATGSDTNIVTLIDMRKGKQLKTMKNRQTVGPIQSPPVWHATLTLQMCDGSAAPAHFVSLMVIFTRKACGA